MDGFLIPFITIALAEMLDKSQLAVLLLAGRYKTHTSLFLGVTLAFLALSALAVLAGSFVTGLIPQQVLQILAGILFILVGILSFRHDADEEKIKASHGNAFMTGFSLLFLAELGDKTQLATAVFATQYNPLLVFFGAFLALSTLAFLALKVGKVLAKKLNKNLIHKGAGIIFILLGLLFLFF